MQVEKTFLKIFELSFDSGQEMPFYKEQNFDSKFVTSIFHLPFTKKVKHVFLLIFKVFTIFVSKVNVK